MSSFLPLDIGPFRLRSRMGIGGMGEVFRAVHTGRDFPVAVKIMSAERARDPDFRAAVRQEIRAVARLYHPGIVMVFDRGEISPEIEEATEGRFVTGSSWFAMELASYSLKDVDRSVLDWWRVRNVFVRILDALAHSHARAVIHRDLKPGNVLFVEGSDGRHLKLTDFGLAHALDDESEAREEGLSRKITGTPGFMSPEQITGQWRNHGPWTDLYAVGCLAYWLLEGEPPFQGGDTDRVLERHLEDPLPPLHASFEVPPGFGSWLAKLLAKNPAERFQRAADAARALFGLGDPAGQRRPDDHPRLEFEAPLDEGVDILDAESDMGMTELLSDVIASPSIPDLQALEKSDRTPGTRHLRDTVDIPQNWQRREPPPLSTDLIGVGLGLFGLREIPFVDRDDERDRLWSALRRVGETKQPHFVMLRGATGTGKSRLANWICERAHELGAATPLCAVHSPMGGARDGLAAMFANHLRCTDLDRDRILDRTRNRLQDKDLDPDALHDCLAMTEFIAPAVLEDYSEDNARIRFRSPEERHGVIFRFLERLVGRRPLILLADDLQWGNETLNALEYLLDTAEDRDLPLLVLGTIQTDALVDREVARHKIDQITRDERTETISVGPLARDDHRDLIGRLLGLEDDLVERVAERTDGNPLYAVQLVGDWVERDLLELGEEGFRLRADERATLPDDLQDVFRDRLAKLVGRDLDAEPGDAILALEIAAVLGTEVQRVEWNAVCSRRSIRLPFLVLDTMVTNDLAVQIAGGWRFAHQAFRETLLHNARRRGRLKGHHLECARAIDDIYPDEHPDLASRLARHLVAAEQFREALDPLLDAAEQSRIRCDFELAEQLYGQYGSLLDSLGANDDDPRRIRGWIEHGQTLFRREQLGDADELLARSEHTARRIDADDLLAEALTRRAEVAERRGDVQPGMQQVDEARTIYERLGDLEGRARTCLAMADLQYWAGDYHDAESNYHRALDIFRTIDQPLDLAHTEEALGTLYTALEQPERAQEMLEDARDVFDEHGDLRKVAHCFNNLGETYRAQDRLAEAEDAYQTAYDLMDRIGLSEQATVLFNLGLVQLAQGRVEDADRLFRRVLDSVSGSDRRGFLGLAHVARLPGAAHRRDWNEWDRHLEQAREHLEATGFVDPDLAHVISDAARRALQVGESQRAKSAFAVARNQWLNMGRQDRAAEIDRVMPEG